MTHSEITNKRILIYYSQFNIGGAEKSNLRLINMLVEKGWKVTLLLRYANGTLEAMLPKEIDIIYLGKVCYPALLSKERNTYLRLIKGIEYSFPYILQAIKRYIKLLDIERKYFDVAVIGLQGLNPSVVVKHVNSTIKLLWIRNDMLHCDPDGHVSKNIRKYGNKIDYFPCVSGTAYHSFIETFPEYKHKARLFYNVMNAPEMRSLGNEICELDGKYTDAIKIITVCRVSDKAKGVFRMLNVYRRLREAGIFFYWIIVGDGPDFGALKKKVNEYGLDDGFILLGRRENPFPIYKYCDISATLSYYEGLCGTVNEAKIMGLPVIATEFSGIHEQITNGKNGWILENNEDAIYKGMKEIISSSEMINAVKNDFLPEAILNDDIKESLLIEMIREKKNKYEK